MIALFVRKPGMRKKENTTLAIKCDGVMDDVLMGSWKDVRYYYFDGLIDSYCLSFISLPLSSLVSISSLT